MSFVPSRSTTSWPTGPCGPVDRSCASTTSRSVLRDTQPEVPRRHTVGRRRWFAATVGVSADAAHPRAAPGWSKTLWKSEGAGRREGLRRLCHRNRRAASPASVTQTGAGRSCRRLEGQVERSGGAGRRQPQRDSGASRVFEASAAIRAACCRACGGAAPRAWCAASPGRRRSSGGSRRGR